MAYDEKFRRRVIAYKEAGHTFFEVYDAFGVTARSYNQWKKQIEQNGVFVYNYPKEHHGKIDVPKLLYLAEAHKDWYLKEFAEVFTVWPQSIKKQFDKHNITRKKKRLLTPKNQKKSGKSI